MQVSLENTHARVHRLLARLSALTPIAVDSDPSTHVPPSLSHLFRLLPLTYPDPAHFSLGGSMSMRVVAVTELGLHPRGALLHAVPLRARIIVGRLSGSIMEPAGAPVEMANVEQMELDQESGKTTLELVWNRGELDERVKSIDNGVPGVKLFVHIGPASEEDHDQVVPVVLGPFHLPGQDENVGGQMGEESVDVYRPFDLSPTPSPNGMDKQCLVKEDWGLGIPGKVWDSAIILSRLLLTHPLLTTLASTTPPPISILDLSSGTGHLASLLAHLVPPAAAADIYCTDLPEALPLLHASTASSSTSGAARIHVSALPWGDSLARPVDLAVCSDVLYEAHFFDALADTLRGSVKVGGRVVVGYKPRGLSVEEEDAFLVERMAGGFRVVEVVAGGGVRFGVVVVVYERVY